MARTRLIIQALSTALANGYLKGFWRRGIYRGNLKYLCVPGLNCYSCPGAVGSCPIGALQNTLSSGEYRVALYAIGFLTIFGTILGRITCGFLCPFGLVQDLLFRIPFAKKLKALPGERFLKLLRYVVLVLFVVLLPLFAVDAFGLGAPWFCKYLCPAGTLEGGIPLVLLNKTFRCAIGFLYTWKLFLLLFTILVSMILWRPFCRYICPLGAIYGIFNRIAVFRYALDTEKCIDCRKCREACNLALDPRKSPNSMDCVRCGKCLDACPTKALDLVSARRRKG